MSPRPRDPHQILPNGIKALALPTGVYFERTGRGRWLLKRRVPGKIKPRYTRLGGPEMTLRDLWEAYELAVAPPPATTIGDLIGEFQRSRIWVGLSQNTQRDYQCCADAIQKQQTTGGVPVGETRLIDWTPGAVRKYVDRRGESSISRANHELRFLRRLFAWGYERDIMASNPGAGVKTLPEPPRQRYVSDAEYEAFLMFAGPRYPYLVPVAELAYLCRLRLSEVCDIRRADITPAGLYAARRKGSQDALTGITPRLPQAIDLALSLHGQIASLYLIAGASHGRMAETTIQTAWQRAMVAWSELGNARWTCHDLKRKGISDTEGDKLAASGHRTLAMLRVYDVLPAKAQATR